MVVVLVGLAGCTASRMVDGEAVGGVWVEAAGLVVPGFLLFLCFSGSSPGSPEGLRYRVLHIAQIGARPGSLDGE